MAEGIAISIAAISLLISGIHLWWTLIRRGVLKITQPTFIALTFEKPDYKPKVFLRGLLYSSSQKGQIIENMYVILSSEHANQLFDFWGYGEGDLVKGSGLFVGSEGVAHNHHFLLSEGDAFDFVEGKNTLCLFANCVNRTRRTLLCQIEVQFTEHEILALKRKNTACIEWSPDTGIYRTSIMGDAAAKSIMW